MYLLSRTGTELFALISDLEPVVSQYACPRSDPAPLLTGPSARPMGLYSIDVYWDGSFMLGKGAGVGILLVDSESGESARISVPTKTTDA